MPRERGGTKPQFQFRPEKRVRACLEAYLEANAHLPDSEVLNILIAYGLRSQGIDPWSLPEPARLNARARAVTIDHHAPSVSPLYAPLRTPTEVPITYAVSAPTTDVGDHPSATILTLLSHTTEEAV